MKQSPDKKLTLKNEFEVTEETRAGLRLMKAFLDIDDPSERILVIEFAERLAHKERSKSN